MGEKNFHLPLWGRMVALRSGFLGSVCAGLPIRAFPAFAGSRVGWYWS